MNADLQKYPGIRVNPRGLLVFGFVSPLSLKSSHAAKILQVSGNRGALRKGEQTRRGLRGCDADQNTFCD
jgi:hypothetical protein